MSSLANSWARSLGAREFIYYLKLFDSDSTALTCLYDYVLYDLTQREGYIYTSGLFASWDKKLMGPTLTRGLLFITDNKPQLKGIREIFKGT